MEKKQTALLFGGGILVVGLIAGLIGVSQRQNIFKRASGADLNPGVLNCDPGADPYNSRQIYVSNNTSETIDSIMVNVTRCEYVPGRLDSFLSSYRCEGGANACSDGAASCFVGEWDASLSEKNIVLGPGESRTFSVNVDPCEITQLDVENEGVSAAMYDCHNVQSRYTVPVGEMWPGGIAFAIDENSEGYDSATGTCPQKTPTPTSPVPTTPAAPTNTPQPTTTPGEPTYTPVPTATPTAGPPKGGATPTDIPVSLATPTPPQPGNAAVTTLGILGGVGLILLAIL